MVPGGRHGPLAGATWPWASENSAGATLTLIAEEFPGDEPIPLARLVDVLEASMLKRIAHGRPFGVAVLAEGIGLRLPPDELQQAMPEAELDEHGHVRLAELELDRLLAKQVKDRFKERGQKITVEGKNIGYELRCAPPIPFDIEYTRDLGYGAVDYLKQVLEGDEPGGMVTLQEGHMVPLPFGSFSDPETGRVRIRLVNVEVELVPGSPRIHDPAGPRGPRGSGEAPPDRSGVQDARPRPSATSTAILPRAEHQPPSRPAAPGPYGRGRPRRVRLRGSVRASWLRELMPSLVKTFPKW